MLITFKRDGYSVQEGESMVKKGGGLKWRLTDFRKPIILLLWKSTQG